MRKHRLGDKLIVIFLFVALVLPVVTMNRVKGKISETENRVLASFPEIFDQQGNFIPDAVSGIQNWFNDNLGFRSELVSLNSLFQFNILNCSPSEKVEIGKDGWFFYTQDNNIDIAKGTYPNFQEADLQKICVQQTRIQQKLKEKGIEYVLILPPSKVSIYPEYIRSGDYTIRKTPDDILADYLEAHTTIKVIRLKDELINQKDIGQLYLKTDTHWNELGSYVGYNKIINDLNKWGIINDEPAEVEFEDGYYKGEFSAMMGNINLLEPESCPKSKIVSPDAVKIEDGERYNEINEQMQTYYPNSVFYLYQNSDVEGPKVLMYGDSMFGSWNITELLAENFSEFTFIWDYEIKDDILESIKPDIIFYDMGERYLNQLHTKSSSFIQIPLNAPDAEISSAKVDRATVEVSVTNMGTESWHGIDQIRLGLWKNNVDTGYRIEIPSGVTVAPGESIVFTSEDFPFNIADGAYYEFQMLQEGIQYFGEKERVDITAVSGN